MAGQQNQMMESGRLYGQGGKFGNIEGVSLTSSNIANQLATRDYGRKRGLWDMLGMAAGGGSGGLFGGLGSLFGL
jgi:hypothetical protein